MTPKLPPIHSTVPAPHRGPAALGLALRLLGVALATLCAFALLIALQRWLAGHAPAPGVLLAGAALLVLGLRGLVTLPGAAPRTLALLALDLAVLALAAGALLAGGLAEG